MGTSFGQMIKTKDGVELGEKSMFVEQCVSSANTKMLDIEGVLIGIEDYCSCVCDALFPRILSAEILEATANDSMEELLLGGDNFTILMDCVKGHMEYSDDFSLNHVSEERYLPFAIKACVSEIIQDPEMREIWSDAQAEEYCDCAIRKLAAEGFSIGQLSNLENIDSEEFNEIVVPCVTMALSNTNDEIIEEAEEVEEVLGELAVSVVQLVEIGGSYKVKLSIDGVTRYFLLDTGAADLIINSEIERELLLNGSLTRDSYMGKDSYTMADNRVVEADMVRVNNITIGDFTVNNVTVAILPEGSLLCGTSLLNKFADWSIEKKSKLLILEK